MEKVMKNNKLIHDNDFCMITSDKFAEEGIKVGQRVFVAGHRAIPEDERDPYTQRIKFFVYLLDKNKHVDFAKGLFLMDPKSLKRVNKGEQHKLLALLEVDIEAASSAMPELAEKDWKRHAEETGFEVVN